MSLKFPCDSPQTFPRQKVLSMCFLRPSKLHVMGVVSAFKDMAVCSWMLLAIPLALLFLPRIFCKPCGFAEGCRDNFLHQLDLGLGQTPLLCSWLPAFPSTGKVCSEFFSCRVIILHTYCLDLCKNFSPLSQKLAFQILWGRSCQSFFYILSLEFGKESKYLIHFAFPTWSFLPAS